MKRWTLVASFALFILLCASIAYWGLQLFKPPLRPVAAPPRVAKADINPDAAATLFGARAGRAAVASNYQLKGVVMSGSEKESVAILSADGKPAQAIRVDAEIAPGVTVKEVHRDYVLLSDGGTVKRVELPENAKSEANLATVSPVRVQPQAAPAARPTSSVPAQSATPSPVMSVVPGASTSQVPAAAANPGTATTSVAPATSSTVAPPSSVASPSSGQSVAPANSAATTSAAPTSAAPAMTPQNSGGAQQQAVPDAAAARMRGSAGFRK